MFVPRNNSFKIIVTVILVVLLSLCSKSYASRNKEQLLGRKKGTGGTNYFLKQGAEDIKRIEEKINRNSNEIEHVIDAANRDEEVSSFRFASSSAYIGDKGEVSMKTKKVSGEKKKADQSQKKTDKVHQKAADAQSKTDVLHAKAYKKASEKCGKSGKKSGKTMPDGKGGCVAPPKNKPKPPPKKTEKKKPPPPPAPPTDTDCVMCEYILETITRKVKSQPPLQQSMAATDIGGTSKLPEDAYRTYQGPPIFFQLGSQVKAEFASSMKAKKGSAKGKKAAQKEKKSADKKAKAGKKADAKAGKKKAKADAKAAAKASAKVGEKPKYVPPAPVLPPPKKDKPLPAPPKKPKGLKVGTFTKKQLEQVQLEGEKSAEFEATYKQWMDALDDVCYHGLPPKYYNFCKRMYENGDKIVEMYLHGYEDYEICSATACPSNFFDKE